MTWRHTYLYPFHAVNQGIRRAVAKAASGCVGGTLLDVGCGTRPYEPLFRVERCFGFDLPKSPHPFHQKRAHVWFDGEMLPVRDRSAQHVLCSAVLQYCRDPRSFIGELARVLAPGGSLILVAPQSEPLTEEPFDRYRFTLSGLRELCGASGLRIVTARPAVGFWQSIAFHVNHMAVRSTLKRGRFAAALFCCPLGFLTQSAAALLDRFTTYNSDTNSWVVHAIKARS